MTPKVWPKREKIEKIESCQYGKVCSMKDPVKKLEKTSCRLEKNICKSHVVGDFRKC